jgi:hypothetical protein
MEKRKKNSVISAGNGLAWRRSGASSSLPRYSDRGQCYRIGMEKRLMKSNRVRLRNMRRKVATR